MGFQPGEEQGSTTDGEWRVCGSGDELRLPVNSGDERKFWLGTATPATSSTLAMASEESVAVNTGADGGQDGEHGFAGRR